MERSLELHLLDKPTAFLSGDLNTPSLRARNCMLKKIGFAL